MVRAFNYFLIFAFFYSIPYLAAAFCFWDILWVKELHKWDGLVRFGTLFLYSFCCFALTVPALLVVDEVGKIMNDKEKEKREREKQALKAELEASRSNVSVTSINQPIRKVS